MEGEGKKNKKKKIGKVTIVMLNSRLWHKFLPLYSHKASSIRLESNCLNATIQGH